ncbi:MAG: hypothetical protein CVT72_15955, partial [Alphaproteobacteria bacterium HGW-Alphaproteobacteria-11]
YQVKLIWQARAKTDPIDARKLADLLRTNLLPVVWVPSLEIRARRKLLRGRAYLVRLRTSVKNRIHGHLTAENCRTEVTDLYGKAGRAWLATVELSEMGRIQVVLLLAELGNIHRSRTRHEFAQHAGQSLTQMDLDRGCPRRVRWKSSINACFEPRARRRPRWPRPAS